MLLFAAASGICGVRTRCMRLACSIAPSAVLPLGHVHAQASIAAPLLVKLLPRLKAISTTQPSPLTPLCPTACAVSHSIGRPLSRFHRHLPPLPVPTYRCQCCHCHRHHQAVHPHLPLAPLRRSRSCRATSLRATRWPAATQCGLHAHTHRDAERDDQLLLFLSGPIDAVPQLRCHVCGPIVADICVTHLLASTASLGGGSVCDGIDEVLGGSANLRPGLLLK